MPDDRTFVTREEYEREKQHIEDRFSNDEKRLSEAEKSVVELAVICNGMAGIPNSISKLETSVAVIETKVSTIDKKLDGYVSESNKKDAEHTKAIREIDDKSKIDFVGWIKNNWMAVASFLAFIWFAIKDFMK